MTAVLFLLWCLCVALWFGFAKVRADRDEWKRLAEAAVRHDEQETRRLHLEIDSRNDTIIELLREREAMAFELGIAEVSTKETRWN